MSLKEHVVSLMTVREVAERLGLSKVHVRRLAAPGAPLEAERVAPILIDPARVEKFAEQRRSKAHD